MKMDQMTYLLLKMQRLLQVVSLEVMSGNKLVLQNDGSNGDNLEALASA